jgi:hypothetical protein
MYIYKRETIGHFLYHSYMISLKMLYYRPKHFGNDTSVVQSGILLVVMNFYTVNNEYLQKIK